MRASSWLGVEFTVERSVHRGVRSGRGSDVRLRGDEMGRPVLGQPPSMVVVDLTCLSKTTRFADRLALDGIQISFSYGSDERGSNIGLQYSEDPHLGGMVLSITASGY